MMKGILLVLALTLFRPASSWATTGTDSQLRILGWSAEHQTAFLVYLPGGEWEMAELWALNLKEQVLEKAACETCSELTLDSPGIAAGERALSPTERGYLKVLRQAKQLARLEEIPLEKAAAAGLTFACDPPRRGRCADQGPCLRHACSLTVAAGESGRITFGARDKRYQVRLFKIPAFPKAALAWIRHRGNTEIGYREDRILFVPMLRSKTLHLPRFVAKYF